jgi:subtilase family serine protease
MKRSIELMVLAIAVLLFGFVTSLPAQESTSGAPITVSEANKAGSVHIPSAPGQLVIPSSSMIQKVPAGHKFAAHTNIEFYLPAGITPEALPPYPGLGYETPASVACIYGFTTAVSGCNPNNSSLGIPSGGSKSIAIVDAYDDPSGPSDLAWFSMQFGLPDTLSTLQVFWANTYASSCYYSGVPVDESGSWELEESLDFEWAHAMAPSATIYLVEACSNFDTDLQQAVLVANNLVNCGQTGIGSGGVLSTTVCGTTANAGEVSMSWGGGEFSSESASDSCASLDDSCFTASNVVYFASAGDSPGVIWPGTSPNVVSVGGITHRRNPTTLNILQGTVWVYTGGGQSYVEPQPSYQNTGTNYAQVQSVCGTAWRCVPDVDFLADPFTGVYVYDTFPMYGYVYQWWVLGGTSLSAPAMAGIINNAATRSGSWAVSSNAELTTIYNNMTTKADFTDVTVGWCGYYMGFTAGTGWDLCSGVGIPHTYAGK